jgi:regulator of RNase E activity RraA
MVPGVRFAGAALTGHRRGRPPPHLRRAREAQPGEVLVIATGGGRLAVLGELFATEARRRGLAGVGDRRLLPRRARLRELGLPCSRAGRSRPPARPSRARRCARPSASAGST